MTPVPPDDIDALRDAAYREGYDARAAQDVDDLARRKADARRLMAFSNVLHALSACYGGEGSGPLEAIEAICEDVARIARRG